MLAGWHICLEVLDRVDVLERLLASTPIGRIAGVEVMKFESWQRLNADYAEQFGIASLNWSSSKG